MKVQSKKSNNELTIPTYLKFVFGGFSGIAAVCCTHPLDLLKTRAQANSGSQQRLKTVFYKLKSDGFLTVYSGLSAGILRQAVYTTSRLGMYSWMLETTTKYMKTDPSFGMKLSFGLIAGGTASLISTPADVALVRMTIDKRLPENQRCNYRNVFQALYRISKTEGFFTMWRNVWSSVVKNEGFASLWKGFTPYLFRTIPHGVLVFIFLEQLNIAYFKYVLKREQSSRIL